MKKHSFGFTLVEVIVVVSVIAILAAVIYANFNQGSAQARDAQRKADLRLVQNALELYKLEHGRYPEGCNGANGDAWSGESKYADKCAGGGADYIRGAVGRGFAPEFIPVLPKDPRPGTADADYGYVYRTNAQGTVYKFVARNSVETETVNYSTEFSPCDVKIVSGVLFATTPITGLPQEGASGGNPAYAYGSCNRLSNGAGGWINLALSDCSLANIAESYAVWGGYADPVHVPLAGSIDTNEEKVEYGTEQVICDMP